MAHATARSASGVAGRQRGPTTDRSLAIRRLAALFSLSRRYDGFTYTCSLVKALQNHLNRTMRFSRTFVFSVEALMNSANLPSASSCSAASANSVRLVTPECESSDLSFGDLKCLANFFTGFTI